MIFGIFNLIFQLEEMWSHYGVGEGRGGGGGGLKNIHCVGCAYPEEWVIFGMWFGRRVVWQSVTSICPKFSRVLFLVCLT